MRKKGNLYAVFLMIAVILAVLASIVLMYTKFQEYKDRIGTTQFYLMRTYENGETVLSYLDSSFRASFLASLSKGASTGFLYDVNCTDDPKERDYYGFRKVNTNEKSCQEKPSGNIKKELSGNMKKTLNAFSKAGIPDPGYGFYFLENKKGVTVAGNQKNDLALEIMAAPKGKCCQISYTYNTINAKESYFTIDKGDCRDALPIGAIGITYTNADPEKCIAEGEIVLSLADKKRVVQTQAKEEETEVIPISDNPDIPETLPSQSAGKCGFVADYAKKYIGCRYLLDVPEGEYYQLARPQNCNSVGGLSCITFVQSVLYFSLGADAQPWGDGKQACDTDKTIKFGKDVSKLQPGDVFAAQYLRNDGSYSSAGHTGMYIGVGTLSQGESYWTSRICYRKFTPDPNGQPIFIHSIGSANLGPPGVCYESYNQLFKNSRFVLTSFCRPRKCN